MTCELDVNTSISGNVINVIHETPSFGDPIVLAGTVTLTTSGTVLSNIPVSSGVRFSIADSSTRFVVGGISGNMASFVDDTNFNGLLYFSNNAAISTITELIPVTNLNQLSVAGTVGKKASYFAVTISG